jgi:hypothetical protein
MVYTIALGNPPPPQASAWNPRREVEAQFALRTLATDAGGRAFFPTRAAELPAIYETIGRELACQYTLAYVPRTPGDGEFRRIAVRVLPPTQATARTRSGYIAARPPTAISRPGAPQPRNGEGGRPRSDAAN